MKIMCKKKVYKLCQYYVGETAYIAVRAMKMFPPLQKQYKIFILGDFYVVIEILVQ